MATLREAAQMALEALEMTADKFQVQRNAITELRQALAQDSLRKLAEIDRELGLFDEPIKSEHTAWITAGNHTVPLEVVPPKREWVGLTWDEIDYCFESCVVRKFSQDGKEEGCVNTHEVAKAIEAKLKEKNA